jgi:hypothetical protein
MIFESLYFHLLRLSRPELMSFVLYHTVTWRGYAYPRTEPSETPAALSLPAAGCLIHINRGAREGCRLQGELENWKQRCERSEKAMANVVTRSDDDRKTIEVRPDDGDGQLNAAINSQLQSLREQLREAEEAKKVSKPAGVVSASCG